MLKKVVVALAAAAALGALTIPASADPSVCYDVHADLNGTVVAQAGCLPG